MSYLTDDITRFQLRLEQIKLLILSGNTKGLKKLLTKAKKRRESFVHLSESRV